jgi:hypothetical protein
VNLARFQVKNTGFPSHYFELPEKSQCIAHLDYSKIISSLIYGIVVFEKDGK